jgi:hypothetical protein
MRKAVLISSHCEDEEKREVLKSNVKKLKSIDIDIILYSTVNLDSEIIEMVDHYFYTKNNPILKFPIKGISCWRIFELNGEHIKVFHILNDYGWAGAFQYKNLLSLSKLFNYDVSYVMIYDVKLDDEIIDFFLNNEETVFFPSKHENNVRHWNVGSHLMSLSKNDLEIFISELTVENYLQKTETYLESFIEEICLKYNWKISEKMIVDQINRLTDPYSSNITEEGINFYFINNYKNGFYHVLFFNVTTDTDVEIIFDDEKVEKRIQTNDIIEIKKPINTFIIKINQKEYNLSKDINNFNLSYFNII